MEPLSELLSIGVENNYPELGIPELRCLYPRQRVIVSERISHKHAAPRGSQAPLKIVVSCKVRILNRDFFRCRIDQDIFERRVVLDVGGSALYYAPALSHPS